MTPISSRSGPRTNPPPDPSRPPTVPPKIPQSAQHKMWIGVHSMEASQIDSVLPLLIPFLCTLYSLTASYPNNANAIGNCQKAQKF